MQTLSLCHDYLPAIKTRWMILFDWAFYKPHVYQLTSDIYDSWVICTSSAKGQRWSLVLISLLCQGHLSRKSTKWDSYAKLSEEKSLDFTMISCPTLPIWCFGVLWWWTPEKRFDWLWGFGDVKLLIGRFPLGRLRWPSNSCCPGAMTAIGWPWPREWQSGGFWPEMGSKVKGSNKGQTTKKKW